MSLICCKFKKLKKHELNVLQAKKNSNTWIEVFASLKKLKKHEFIFSQNDLNVLQSKKAEKHELDFLQV